MPPHYSLFPCQMTSPPLTKCRSLHVSLRLSKTCFYVLWLILRLNVCRVTLRDSARVFVCTPSRPLEHGHYQEERLRPPCRWHVPTPLGVVLKNINFVTVGSDDYILAVGRDGIPWHLCFTWNVRSSGLDLRSETVYERNIGIRLVVSRISESKKYTLTSLPRPH